MKYNPAFLDDEALIESFVSRHVDLELILETIRENTRDSNQHVLLIGPRGIGKTTLVLRVAAEIRATDELQEQWYPLVFGEESYGVSTPGEFWLEALLHLGGQTQDERWQQAYEDLRTERDEDRLRQRALIQLMDFADEQDTRLLLIVENLNMLIGAQMSSDDAWGLRHTLMNEPRLMLLGTATSRFKEVEDYGQALYDLFKLVELDPLDDEDARALWTSITGKTPSPLQIRPVQILTGGNPRLIRIISEFAADVSFSELMDDMIHLVDEHTEYFKHHLDSLPVQERKVFVALADLWDPSPARAVAELARLDVNKASALLRRLTDRGAVTVPYQRGRAKYYQVAERMYNVYHLMRRRGQAASRVQAVVRFMTHLYQGERLVQATRSMLEEAGDLTREQRRAHLLAYQHILKATDEPALYDQLVEAAAPYLTAMPDAPPSVLEMMDDLETGDATETAETDGEHASLLDLDVEQVDDTKALLKMALALTEQADRQGEAEAAYRKVLQNEPKNPIAWNRLGKLLTQQGRHDEALLAYDQALALRETNAATWLNKGLSLDKLGHHEEALKASDQALSLGKNDASAWSSKGVALYKLGRYEEALEAFDQALSFGKTDAFVWRNQGAALGKLGRHEEALESFEQALALDDTDALACYGKGTALDKLGRHNEALEASDQALALDETYALAWHSKGIALKNLGHHQEALEAFDQVLSLNDASPTTWHNRGIVLYKLGHREEAISAYDRALALAFDRATSSNWRSKRPRLAMLLGTQSKWQEALSHAHEFLRDTDMVEAELDGVIDFFVGAAAAGHGDEALEQILASPSAELLEPLAVALQLRHGEEVDVAREIYEVARDVIGRIEARIEAREEVQHRPFEEAAEA